MYQIKVLMVGNPAFRREPAIEGRKQRHHRMDGPAFLKHTLKAKYGKELFAEELMPVLDHSKLRSRGISKATHQEYRHGRRSEGWKAQTKAGSQWAKHKRGCSKVQLRKAAAFLGQGVSEPLFAEELLDELYCFYINDELAALWEDGIGDYHEENVA